MTKEQEVIEYLKESVVIYKNTIPKISKAIETVLNMLKEKDIQINSKNGTINALQCVLKERTEERDRKDNIVTKQNKIIDLMADFIYKIWCDYPGSIFYKLKKVGFDESKCGFCEHSDRMCKDCLKQYFAGLVEKGSEKQCVITKMKQNGQKKNTRE